MLCIENFSGWSVLSVEDTVEDRLTCRALAYQGRKSSLNSLNPVAELIVAILVMAAPF